MEFNIVNENNEFKLGNIISVFKIPETNREIALFSVDDFDPSESSESSLNIAYIDTDKDGYDYISEIEDDNIYKKAMNVVKELIEVINNE